MMAKKPSGGDWALELHLTPKWVVEFGRWESATIYGDFTSIISTLSSIANNYGEEGQDSVLLNWFPEEFNFTVDGVKISHASKYVSEEGWSIYFGDYIFGYLLATHIYLEKW